MSYQVLARKWRPHNFQNMVGQEHILRMLANALEQKRIHHAYLFTGTRGVGKTTIARILARCLNCETGITSTPCGTCSTCKAIDAGKFLDLYEIDAASRTKVEDTRELLDNVPYPPSQGRYKVYLIDEVHMLSNHSFNALLKTLEEPPEHVKFLLATTDPKKLPVTILSRCLQFHLKRITPEQIAKHLQHICSTENITHETAALESLAKAADGSMRDALSILDQAIAYGHGTVSKTDVSNMLGSMAQDDLLPLLTAIAAQDGKELFSVVKQLAERAPDFDQVLEELISTLHKVALTQIIPDATHEETIKTLASQLNPEDVQLYYQIALLGRRDLSLCAAPQQGFEMTMLRMLAFNPGKHHSVTRPVPEKIAVAAKPAERITTSAAPKKEASVAARMPFSDNLLNWPETLPKLELAGMAYALAANCTLKKYEGNKIELALSANHAPMLNPKSKERVAEALSRVLNQTIQLEIIPTTDELLTPSKLQAQENNTRLSNAKQTIMDDPKVKNLLEMYDATVEVSLIPT